MAIRALVADDELSARSRMRKLLAAYPSIAIEAEAHDGLATLEAIQRHRPDVVFLDVQMPGMSGFEVIEALTPECSPLIVFVTAYDEYALAAFEADAVAYLLKPVLQARLHAVVQRLERIVGAPDQISQEVSRARGVALGSRQPLHHALAIQRERHLLVPLADVCFFRVEEGVTRMKTSTAMFRTRYAIGDLEARLPRPPFFRAHRAVIANLDWVASVSPLFKGALLLSMKDEQGSEIQVSERQAASVRQLLGL